jgi:alkylated DNA repair protein (DNA oxidative demethylase)
MTFDLFADLDPVQQADERLGEQACVLRGFALPQVAALLPALDDIVSQAAFRHMVTPGGFTMSVALSNCGALGWVSDRRGYRYGRQDPETGLDWPPLPTVFQQLAHDAAHRAGFADFVPDACLINRYLPGTRMSLHQDRNERDPSAPIVSVSLGLPASFQFGGHARSDKTQKVVLQHGDVVVWGGVDRLRFHGVLPLKPGIHPLLGEKRINLTFRKAG